jgi:uncharacterized protein DUF6794
MPTTGKGKLKGNGHDHDWLQTVNEAVERILQGTPSEDKEQVRSTPEDDLILFHFGWGTGIRNEFGL